MNELKRWTYWLINWAIILYTVGWLIGITPIGRDETDPGEWGARSNLAIRTDSQTGCQYLAASSGGLTPRLDANGRHIGCKGVKG